MMTNEPKIATPNRELRNYTYSIFDANPHNSSGTVWPSHCNLKIVAKSDLHVTAYVKRIMRIETAHLHADDGYEVGQQIYAIIWHNDVIVAELTRTLRHVE